jgi:hypothetical protein
VSRYGEGYRVSLVAPASSVIAIKQAATSALGRDPIDEAAGATIYTLPDQAAMSRAPALFSVIEEVQAGKRPGLQLTDFGVSHTTLEDVFVSLAHGGDEQTKGRKKKRDLFKVARHHTHPTTHLPPLRCVGCWVLV